MIENLIKEDTKDEVKFYDINYKEVSQMITEIEEKLEKRIKKAERDSKRKIIPVLSIHDLEKLFDQSIGKRLTEILNLLADVFEMKYFGIIWIEDKYVDRLSMDAPDLWQAKTAVFRFQVPKEDVEWIQPIILLSYSAQDKDFVNRLLQRLKKYKVDIRKYELGPTKPKIEEIFESGLNKKYFIPVLSGNYLRSSFSQDELNSILRQFRSNIYGRVVPIFYELNYENLSLPHKLSQFRSIEFREDIEEQSFENLVKELDIIYSKPEDNVQEELKYYDKALNIDSNYISICGTIRGMYFSIILATMKKL